MKKIRRIEAKNSNGKIITWSADNLFWDELPKSLLNKIEVEYPTYQLNIEYYGKSTK